MTSYNEQIIAEFRANNGRVGGMHAGIDMLLLTTTGRRTGLERVTPLAHTWDGDRAVVAASNGGSDQNPAWFHNVLADPDVTVEVGGRTVPARAVVPEGPERDRLWAAHVEAMPPFGDYEKGTDRVIPVVVLEPKTAFTE